MNKITIVAIILIIFGSIVYSVSYHNSVDEVSVTVVDKERINTTKSGKFLIYGQDEVFENTDSYVFLKFTSADLQRDLIVGETYTVKVAGWRIPFLSMFRNIITVEDEQARS